MALTELTVRQAIQADRDAAVLTWLARLQLATADQIAALGWPGLSRSIAMRRLRRTRQTGLLEFVSAKTGAGRRVVLYRLTPAGAIAAAELLGDPQVTHGVRVAAIEGIHLEHRVRVNDMVVCLVERLGPGGAEVLLPHQRRLRWQVSGGAWHEVTSDAVLVLHEAEMALVLEYDRGLRSLEGIAGQLRRYREAVEQPDLPGWVARSSIVYVLHPPSPARATSILSAAAEAGLEARVAVIAAHDLAVVTANAVVTAHAARIGQRSEATASLAAVRQEP